VVDAFMAAYKPGAEDALLTPSAGLIGEVWIGGRKWFIMELFMPECCPFWFVVEFGEASETEWAYWWTPVISYGGGGRVDAPLDEGDCGSFLFIEPGMGENIDLDPNNCPFCQGWGVRPVL
jgi:hypothetical protein